MLAGGMGSRLEMTFVAACEVNDGEKRRRSQGGWG